MKAKYYEAVNGLPHFHFYKTLEGFIKIGIWHVINLSVALL